MIKREKYLEELRPYINRPIIKVITGIRRAGKSELLKMIREELLQSGVEEQQVLYANFESFHWNAYKQAASLYALLEERYTLLGGKRMYVLLDEVQEVESWEKVINSLMADWDVDIYLTGSNSHLLSSELSTYLSGRYIEIRVYPLSFREFLLFHDISPDDAALRRQSFTQYLRQGGFPIAHIARYSDSDIYKLIYDIYSSVLLRDTIQRYKIRNVDMLERLVFFLFNNVGNNFSAKSVSAYLKNQQRKLDHETLYNYLNALQASFILQRAPRYDLKGKELLQTNEKYFLMDISLLHALQGYQPSLIAGMLENVVYIELCRQGFRVYVGKWADVEVDFVAEKEDRRIYVQVCYRVDAPATLTRELAALKDIHDNYPKYLLTTDDLITGSYDGIQCVHICDFLMEDW
jgi:predicted AAA+ superfamily ATPase